MGKKKKSSDAKNHPLRAAHRHALFNRAELLRSEFCRCFYCLATFKAAEIHHWVEEKDQEQSALCPKCSVDSVIGSASGVPMDDDFFAKMRKTYFGK